MKLSVYSLSLKDKSPVQVVELAEKYGCDAIEWWCRENGHVDRANLEQSAREISALMKKTGAEACALSPYFKYSEPKDELRRIFGAARIIGAGLVRCHSYAYPVDAAVQDLIEKQRKWLEQEVIPAADELEVKLVIEQHMNHICCTPNACRELVDGLPANRVGIIYDPGNSLAEGYTSPEYAVSVFGGYLSHVHVKSCRPTTEGYIQRGRKYPVQWGKLAEGDLDWEQIVAALKKANYRGYLSLEALDSRESEQKLKDDIPFLQNILRAFPGASENPMQAWRNIN